MLSDRQRVFSGIEQTVEWVHSSGWKPEAVAALGFPGNLLYWELYCYKIYTKVKIKHSTSSGYFREEEKPESVCWVWEGVRGCLYYGLHCLPRNSHVEVLTLNIITFGDEPLRKPFTLNEVKRVGFHLVWFVTLWKEAETQGLSAHRTKPAWKHRGGDHLWAWESPHWKPVRWHLTLPFQLPELWENVFLLLEPPRLWHLVMAALTDEYIHPSASLVSLAAQAWLCGLS